MPLPTSEIHSSMGLEVTVRLMPIFLRLSAIDSAADPRSGIEDG